MRRGQVSLCSILLIFHFIEHWKIYLLSKLPFMLRSQITKSIFLEKLKRLKIITKKDIDV